MRVGGPARAAVLQRRWGGPRRPRTNLGRSGSANSPIAWRVRPASARTHCANTCRAEPEARLGHQHEPVGGLAVHAGAGPERLDKFAARLQVVHHRQACQRDALAGKCALHLLVGEVQVYPPAGLELRMAVQLQPTPPLSE